MSGVQSSSPAPRHDDFAIRVVAERNCTCFTSALNWPAGFRTKRLSRIKRSKLSQSIVAKIKKLAIPAGLEPATLCLEGRCSIRLSYGI
jgi:hypothetical protein